MNRSWSEETLVLPDSTDQQVIPQQGGGESSDEGGPADSTTSSNTQEDTPQSPPMSLQEMAGYIARFWPEGVESAAERVIRLLGVDRTQEQNFVESVLRVRQRRLPDQFPDQSHWGRQEAADGDENGDEDVGAANNL